MKKLMVIAFFAAFGITSAVNAQRIIARGTVAVPVTAVRPACPGPDYVWIEGSRHWNRGLGRYTVTKGYWRRPHRMARAVVVVPRVHRGWRHGHRF